MIARAGIVRADRRSVLLGAGAAAAGVVASFSSSPAAAQGRVDQECMTIVYQNGPDVRFDFTTRTLICR